VREQPDERGFPGAVRTDDGGVFAGLDRERQGVKDGAVVLDDRCVGKLENRISQ